MIVLALVLVAALLQERIPAATILPGVAVLVLGRLRLKARWPILMNARRVSRKTSLALVALFLLALVPAGHGVAPLALFLVYGWERYSVGTALACLALGFLGSGLVVRAALAPTLSLIGSLIALLAWVLIETSADDFHAAVVGSSPFLLALLIHSIHLWCITPVARAEEA
jgi:hypothetical protein